jgi:hypothetical protein
LFNRRRILHCLQKIIIKKYLNNSNNLKSSEKNLRSSANSISYDGTVTVSFLNELYQIDDNTGNSSLSQSVFETNYQQYVLDDLHKFQSHYNLSIQDPIDVNVNGYTYCFALNDCAEGNLDLQYIMVIYISI